LAFLRSGRLRVIAVGLARAGADLVLHGHHDDLDEVAAEVTGLGRRASRRVLDLADPSRVAEAAETLPPIDILVNAGIIRRGPALTRPASEWTEVLDVNLNAVYFLTRTVGAGMVERGAGKVIMVASVLSFQGGLNVAGYTASKHAIAGLTRALANEWAPHGVQVNAIAPGYITTNNQRPPRRRGPRAGDPRPHPGRSLGPPGGPRRRRRLPGLPRRRLRHRPHPGRRRRLAGPLTPR
jgi:2-dehydro-3-deoxy-D-gluconate 5-dehydrogenase